MAIGNFIIGVASTNADTRITTFVFAATWLGIAIFWPKPKK
jgi:hypothetical protein